MPFSTGKFLLKKGKRYDVATKSLFVLPVQLLDNTMMECTVKEDSSGQDLLLHVAQRLGIHESEIDYFGLKFINKHLQYQWLSLELPLKRQLMKFAHDLFVKFSVRFYIRNVHQLKDEASRYQFFLQLRNEIIEGALLCSPEQAVLLASYSLQAAYGDFDPLQHSPQHLKDFFLLPKRMCVQEEILKDLLVQVADMHRSLQGMFPGMAETYYIIEAQNLEGYGEEYYAAKDASGNDLLLGTSHTGLAIKHPTGRPLLSMSWPELKSVTRAKRSSIRLECAGSGRAAQRVVQIFLENADFAAYVLTNILLQQNFYLSYAHGATLEPVVNQAPRPPFPPTGHEIPPFRLASGGLNGSKPDVVDFHPSIPLKHHFPHESHSENGKLSYRETPPYEFVVNHRHNSDAAIYPINGNSADVRRQPEAQLATQIHHRFSWMGQGRSAEKIMKIQQQVAFNIVNSTPELRLTNFPVKTVQPIGMSSSTPDLLNVASSSNGRNFINKKDGTGFLLERASPLKAAVAQVDLSVTPPKLFSEQFPILSEEEDRLSDGNKSTPSREKTPSRPLLHAAMNGLVLSDRIVDDPTATIPRRKTDHPTDTLRSDLEQRLVCGNVLIEFEQIPKKRRNPDLCTVAMLPENHSRNRYMDVVPYDDTRVELLNPTNDNSKGYINASEIILKCEDLERRYIATQEPLENTIEDFFSMLWQQHTKLLVILSEIERITWMANAESGKEFSIGPFQIKKDFTSASGPASKGYMVSCFWFINKSSKNHGRRKLYIFHLERWSEQGIPESLPSFCQMTQELESYRRQFQSQAKEPIVVLCRTGTGRSGMMILFDFMTLCLDHNQPVDVPRVLAHMRLQRMFMVQTVSQYRFVYAALVQHLSSSRLI